MITTAHMESMHRLRLTLLAAAAVVSLMLCTAAPRAHAAATSAPGAANASRAVDIEQRNRKFQKAEALYLSGRLKDAQAAFADLSHEYPNDARVWLKFGNTLTKLGSYDEAATAFQTAASLDPTQGAAGLNLALVRLLQAQGSLEFAVGRLAPGSPERAQAESLQRQISTLLGTPERPATAH
jgi:tetratricopeptide (TPR) repeat protein